MLFGRGLRLLHDGPSQRSAIFLGTVALFEWADDDGATRRLVQAQLVNAQLATRVAVANVFGLHVNTVSRIARQVAVEGVEATVRRKPGPHGARKVSPAVVAELQRAVEAGLSTRAAQREVRHRLGVALSQPQVHRVMRQLKGQAAEQAELELGPAAQDGQALAEAEESSAGELESGAAADGLADMLAGSTAGFSLAPGDSATSRYLGMTLFYPALQAVGLLEMAAQVYQLAGALRFGVQQVFFELFCLALLQESTVERVKRLLRSDLGAVIGCPRAACVKTLRRKLQALSERRQAARLGLLLARHWLEAGLLNSSYLYVDGHVKVYSGSRLVPEVWNSQRRMPLPGIVEYFVNDLHGRALLVVSEEVRGNLAKSLPSVIAAVRQVVGERRFTVIFDRGGYDGQLFSWLVEQGLDFITYQRGEVRLAADLFARREVRWEGQRVRFHVAEDTVRVGDSGPWRRIVLRTADGHQTPILTSLAAASVAAARVTALMLARWRQENFFKYARAHLGLDTLASYAADTVADREVPNPAAKTATVELKRLRASAQKARAALGQTMVLDTAQPTGETGPATAKQMKAKRASPASRDALIAQLQTIDDQIEQTKARLRSLLPRVLLSSLGPLPQAPRLETKRLVDAVKVAAYNAQSWLADRLAQHYLHVNDLHDLLRSFAYLSGTMTRQADGGIRICLEPPDIPLARRALAGLCADLNQSHVMFPGTDIPVQYELARLRRSNREPNHGRS